MRGELERRVGALDRRGRRAVVAAVIRGEEPLFGLSLSARPAGTPAQPVRDRFDHQGVTGVLFADMVLAGEVALDDPLSRHLSDLRPAWRDRALA